MDASPFGVNVSIQTGDIVKSIVNRGQKYEEYGMAG